MTPEPVLRPPWPIAPGERAPKKGFLPGDSILQREVLVQGKAHAPWRAAVATPRLPGPHRVEPPLGICDALDNRAALHAAFELRRALETRPAASVVRAIAHADGDPAVASSTEIVSQVEWPLASLASRPPLGCGYTPSSYQGRHRPALEDRMAWASAMPTSPHRLDAGGGHRAVPSELADEDGRIESRRERIEALERGLRTHDEDRLRELGKGTAPLLDADLQPVLPVAPLKPHECRMHLPQRLKTLSTFRSSKETIRDALISTEILGREAHDRPFSHATDVLAPSAPSSPRNGSSSPRKARIATTSQGGFGALAAHDVNVLLREAQVLISEGADEAQCARVASQLCAKAYEMDCQDVLRMARMIGHAWDSANSSRTARGKSELLRAADHLVQSLTGRLQDASLEILIDTIETMAEVGVGTQVFMDMIMAMVIARHHRDCQALSPHLALALATALGRVATSSVRLRPRGVGGPGASTNARVMEVLQQRIASQLGNCSEEDLANLDHYYITRLCEETERKAIIIRMSESNLGFTYATKQFMPRMIQLERAIQRELADAFKWYLPRPTRIYLDELKHQGLRENAPWDTGDIFTPARAKLGNLRAAETTVW